MSTGQSLDLSDFGLTRLSQIPQSASFKTSAVLVLTLDGNRLSTLDGLEHYGNVVQLSACNNCLVQISAVQNLPDLVLLNLENNSLMDVSGLEALSKLQWLSLGGNSLKAATVLSHNRLLTHLDLSRNCLSTLPLLTSLPHLSTVLLNGNVISSLTHLESHLPLSVRTLSLAENAIADANQLSFLSELLNLEQLMVAGNPCLMWQGRKVDIGPFVLYWCPRLAVLDGSPVEVADRCVAHLLFPQSSQYPFRLGQQAEVAQYLLQIVPHLMHVAHKLPSTSPSFADSTTVRQRETGVMGGTQPEQGGHTAFHSPVMATDHPAIHPGESASLSKKSEVSELPHHEKDSDSGGLVRLATGSSKDASVGDIDNDRFRPPTTAEEKLEILKRLNSAISEHRKKVGVKSILDENSQSPSGEAPAFLNAGEGRSESPLVLESASVYIPLVSADSKEGSSGAHLIHELPGDLTQMSVTHSVSPVHPSQRQQQQRTQSTPTSSTCSEEDNSGDNSEGEEDGTKMVAHAVRIQAWWKGCAIRRKFANYARREKAAIVIQSAWRGSLSRSRDPKVMWARSELKQRKMEAYVVLLLHQLKGCQQQVAHNAQVIQLQEETLQSLMVDVKSIQDWQDGKERHRQNYAATLIQKHWRGFLARRRHPDVRSLLSKHAPLMSYSLYQALKRDVDALSAKVHNLGVEDRDGLEGARERYERLGFLQKVSGEEHDATVAQTISQSLVASQTSVLDTATAPAVSSSKSVEPLVSGPATKLCPPTNLRMSHYSPSCVQLMWEEPDCLGVLGYNVYVNGAVEGRVGPTRRKAYLDGLDPATTYSIAIRAIYKEGESDESNPILASVKMQPSATVKASKRLHFSLPPKELDSPISSLVFDQRTEREKPETTHPSVSTEESVIQQTAQMHDTSKQLLLQSSSADDAVGGSSVHLHATSNSGGVQAVPLAESAGVDDERLGLGSLSMDVTTGSGLQEGGGISISDARQAEVTPAKGRDSFSPVRSSSPPHRSDSMTQSSTSSWQSDDCLTPKEDESGTSPKDDVENVAPTCPKEDTSMPLLTPTSSSGMTSLNFDWQPLQQASDDVVSLVIDTEPKECPHSFSPQEEGLTSTASVVTVNLNWDELSDAASPLHVPVPLSAIPTVNLPNLSEFLHGGHVSVVNATPLTGSLQPQQCDHRPSTPTDTDQVQTRCSKEEQQQQVATPTSMV